MRALVVFGALASATLARAAPPEESLLYYHCPKEGGEYRGSVTTELVLARSLLDPALSDDENLVLAAKHELRYFWGITRSDPKWPPQMEVALSAAEPTITIIEKHDAPYGRDLALDWTRTEARLKIEPGYIARAVDKKRLAKTDPAIVAKVRIEFDVSLCGRSGPPPSTMRVPLPRDPWLMYWLVPIARHRTLQYYNEIDTTNPCADNDFADLPHPYYYWYDWYPTRVGKDIRGRPFDCTKWLTPGRDYVYYDVALTAKAKPTHELADLRRDLLAAQASRPLRATVMIGVLDHEVTDLQLASWQHAIGAGQDLVARATAAHETWQKDPPHERGTGMLLTTLVELGQQMVELRHESSVEDGYLVVRVSGRLKQSRAPLQLTIVLGMTDVFGPRPPQHWKWLEKGLLEDELVFYWGHSGIGENFRLAQIEKNLGRSHDAFTAAFAKSPLRLVAIISCYSYMYFGQDLLAAGAARKAGGNFVFTGMAHVVRDRGPLPLLELIDTLLVPANTTAHVDRLKSLGDEELWIIKRVAGKN